MSGNFSLGQESPNLSNPQCAFLPWGSSERPKTMKEDYTCQAPDREKDLGHVYLPSHSHKNNFESYLLLFRKPFMITISKFLPTSSLTEGQVRMTLKHGNWVLWVTEGQSGVDELYFALSFPPPPSRAGDHGPTLSGTRRDALPSPTPASLSPTQGLPQYLRESPPQGYLFSCLKRQKQKTFTLAHTLG